MNGKFILDIINNGFVVTLLLAIVALLYWHAIHKTDKSKSSHK